MDPHATAAEALRMLREGGVFAAADADYPPRIDALVDARFAECLARARAFNAARGLTSTQALNVDTSFSDACKAAGLEVIAETTVEVQETRSPASVVQRRDPATRSSRASSNVEQHSVSHI